MLLVAFLLAIFLTQNVFFIAEINGSSMSPTLEDGDRCIAVCLHGEKREHPDYGIYFAYSEVLDENICKRVIGVEGDTLKFIDGNLFRNGEEIEEPYVMFIDYYQGTFVIPAGKVFLAGDNRAKSLDSRLWDDPFVDVKDLRGKAVFQVSPLWKIRSLKEV